MKRCAMCKEDKQDSEFYHQWYKTKSERRKGLRSYCKSCCSAYRKSYYRLYYQKHKKQQRANFKRLSARYKDGWKRLLEEKFGSLSCSVCGYDRCFSAIEFHHIVPKDNNEQSLYRVIGKKKPSKERLEALGEGILLCSNCHREVHDGLIRI